MNYYYSRYSKINLFVYYLKGYRLDYIIIGKIINFGNVIYRFQIKIMEKKENYYL